MSQPPPLIRTTDTASVAPVFQDLSWDNLTTGLLDPDGVSAGFDFATDYYDPNQLSLLDAQGQIEQWAAEHAPSQISSSPTPATEVEERICYGVVSAKHS